MAAIKCPACGVKISEDRTRCPRCRAMIGPDDPEIAASRSRKLASISLGLAGVFVAGVTILWLSSPASTSPAPAATTPAPAPVAPGATGDPLEPVFIDLPWGTTPRNSPEIQQVLEYHQRVVRERPSDLNALTELGRAQMMTGKVNDAVGSFQAAAAVSPNHAPLRVQLAAAQCALARWDECVTTLRRARELTPGDASVAFNLGVALHRRGSDEAALPEYQAFGELKPEDPARFLALGASYDRLGRREDAAEAYETFLRLSPLTFGADKIRSRIAQLKAATEG
jgi:tetratricopeptide (TPR) repeat protein